MRLVVPYIRELHPMDSRLIRLAEFMGIVCAPLPVATQEKEWRWASGASVESKDCLVINPEVIREWQGATPPQDFVTSAKSGFSRMLVYGAYSDPFHDSLLTALTSGSCLGARKGQADSGIISVAPDSRDICEAFAGQSFAVQNLSSDHVFHTQHDSRWRELMTLDEHPFFAMFTTADSDVFLLGSGDVVDLDTEAGDAWLAHAFTKFLPLVMALRYIFGEESWRPTQSYASLIVDDPLLRPNYGFLNYERVLQLMEEHNFHTTIAFIPHNFRRSSSRVVRLFRQNSRRFSLCFHGNDHTGAEFASGDLVQLNLMLQIAERRIEAHVKATGIPCDRVMVFPQGKFSVGAMAALRSRNFDAAVNTTMHPYGEGARLTLRDLAQPAVLRYSEFPLFLRKYSIDWHEADIAFKLFFGIPIIIVEHHEAFRDPGRLIDAVQRINRLAPAICWAGAGDAVRGSMLRSRSCEGVVQLRAYARNIRVENPSPAPQMFRIEWVCENSKQFLRGVYRNNERCGEFSCNESGVCVEVLIDGGKSESFSMLDDSPEPNGARVGFRHMARAFIRRRASEMRDNYISKSPVLTAAAKSLRRAFQG